MRLGNWSVVITSERRPCWFTPRYSVPNPGCREELESATHRLNAHVTELTQRLCKSEVSLQANIHDYLSLRAETLQSTRHMQEQLVAANTARDDALMKLADMQVQPQSHNRHLLHDINICFCLGLGQSFVMFPFYA